MRRHTSVFWAFDAALFTADPSGVQGRIRTSFLFMLFLVGLVHWVAFFHSANLTAYDWTKESAYLNTLRHAISTGTIPWRWSQAYYHGTESFLGIPETKLTPDILILPWVSNSTYVLIHVLLLYSVGFVACLRLAKHLQLTTLSLSLFWLLFNFNGYITAHLAVGHFQWTGYFLLPAFFLLVSQLLATLPRSSVGSKPVLFMILLLGLLFLNGSLHIAVWCYMFMAVVAFWQPSLLKHVAVAFVGGGALGAARLLPAALSFGQSYQPFISGYPSPTILLTALTTLREHNAAREGGIWGSMGWWEYDIFIGFFGVAVLAVGAFAATRSRILRSQTPILVAACVLLLLSLGNGYGLIAKAPIPFAGVERVSSRFVVLPFITLLVIGMIGVDELLRRNPKRRILVLAAAPFMAFELALHSWTWRAARIEWAFPPDRHPPPLSVVQNQDLLYATSVLAGWTLSLCALLAVAWFYLRQKNNPTAQQNDARAPNNAIDGGEE